MRRFSLSTLAYASILGASLFSSTVMAQTMARYQVTVTNLTAHQPLSPLAAVIHSPGYHPFQIGMPASSGLEKLAEGGDVSGFLTEARAHADSVQQTQAGDAPIGPGSSAQVMLHIDASIEDPRLSLATMLVNTNDAFTAVNAHALSGLAVGESMKFTTIAFDAGTEANTEAQGTIPGPADGGEGYNPERETHDRVTTHPGVVTKDEGLATSVLDQSHRFLNPVAQVSITRMEDNVMRTHLDFPSLQTEYHPGDRLVIQAQETTQIRQQAMDLWIALVIPDGTLLFFSPAGLLPDQAPFISQVAPDQRQHVVFDGILPPGLGGAYTLLTFYGSYTDNIWKIHSEITQRHFVLLNE